jgi:hypothetical protein
MSSNSPAKTLTPRQLQTRTLMASPLRPPHLSLSLILQALHTGLAFGQQSVVCLLEMPMVMINTTLPFL